MLGDLNQSPVFFKGSYITPTIFGGGDSWNQAMNTWILSVEMCCWRQFMGFVATQTLMMLGERSKT